jgi:hypothetical protein
MPRLGSPTDLLRILTGTLALALGTALAGGVPRAEATTTEQGAAETPAQAAVSPAGCVIEYVTDPHPSPHIRGAVKVDAKVRCGRPVPEQDLALTLLADGKPVFKTVAKATNKAELFNQSTYIRCQNSTDRHTFQGTATGTSVEGDKPYVRSKTSQSVVLPCGY